MPSPYFARVRSQRSPVERPEPARRLPHDAASRRFAAIGFGTLVSPTVGQLAANVAGDPP